MKAQLNSKQKVEVSTALYIIIMITVYVAAAI